MVGRDAECTGQISGDRTRPRPLWHPSFFGVRLVKIYRPAGERLRSETSRVPARVFPLFLLFGKGGWVVPCLPLDIAAYAWLLVRGDLGFGEQCIQSCTYIFAIGHGP